VLYVSGEFERPGTSDHQLGDLHMCLVEVAISSSSFQDNGASADSSQPNASAESFVCIGVPRV